MLNGSVIERAGVRVWGMGAVVGEESLFLGLPFVGAVDALVTHDAPLGIGDFDWFVGGTGSALVRRVAFEVSPRVHVFGGAPASAGMHYVAGTKGTVFVNAAVGAGAGRKPLVVDIPARSLGRSL